MKMLCLLTITLLCVSAAMAEETFFSALESKAEVEKRGPAPLVVEASPPVNMVTGLLAKQLAMSFTFHVEDRFVNLDEGSVELWVTMGFDVNRGCRRTFPVHDLQTRYRRNIFAV